jgi:hypothetical protein
MEQNVCSKRMGKNRGSTAWRSSREEERMMHSGLADLAHQERGQVFA